MKIERMKSQFSRELKFVRRGELDRKSSNIGKSARKNEISFRLAASPPFFSRISLQLDSSMSAHILKVQKKQRKNWWHEKREERVEFDQYKASAVRWLSKLRWDIDNG